MPPLLTNPISFSKDADKIFLPQKNENEFAFAKVLPFTRAKWSKFYAS